MSYFNLSLRTVTGVAIAAILSQPLAGCSGASSSLPSAAPISPSSVHLDVPAAANAKGSAATRVSPDSGGQQLFVADAYNSKVYVFNAATKVNNPPVERTIVDVSSPQGISTDQNGNLWVADLGSNTVNEFAKNSSTPMFTISNGMSGPVDVKVDGFGNVYVAMNGEYNGGVNSIVEYAAGTANPIYTWNVPQTNMEISGIALVNPTVKNGTSVFALESQFNGTSGSAVGGLLTCYPGAYNEVCTQLTNYQYGQTSGIAIASKSPFEFLAVDQYLPGIDETVTYPQSNKQLISGGTPEGVTLNSKGTRLFVADRFYGQVEEYSFPRNKKLYTFGASGKTILTGVAVYPTGNYL